VSFEFDRQCTQDVCHCCDSYRAAKHDGICTFMRQLPGMRKRLFDSERLSRHVVAVIAPPA
jgi:hypothetical protein